MNPIKEKNSRSCHHTVFNAKKPLPWKMQSRVFRVFGHLCAMGLATMVGFVVKFFC